jgi:hypothetical protein
VLTLFLALDRSADSQFLIILIDLRSLLLIYCTSSSPANPASETGVEMEKRELQPLTKLSCGLRAVRLPPRRRRQARTPKRLLCSPRETAHQESWNWIEEEASRKATGIGEEGPVIFLASRSSLTRRIMGVRLVICLDGADHRKKRSDA